MVSLKEKMIRKGGSYYGKKRTTRGKKETWQSGKSTVPQQEPL